MDYEQKYNEALKRVRNLYNKMKYLSSTDARTTVLELESSFPELAESEDERIRKEIISALKFLNNDGVYDKHIAYLEKQKAKEKYDRMAPVYSDKESFESALDKAWKFYNDSGSRTVDGCEDDYVECAHAKGFREGYLFGVEKQKEEEGYEAIPVESTLEYKLGFKAGKESEKQKEHSMSAEEVLTRAGLKPYKDGNQWCILVGDNIQEGICGFGDTIDEALYQFLMEVLEKQKELPFVKDVILGYPGLYFYDGERMHFQGNPAMEEKQKEQKPEEELYAEAGTTENEYIANTMKMVRAMREKRKEQKPDSLTKYVYSKEDAKFIQDCANILVANDYATSAERLLSMFKQKPAEWSEEDEKNFEAIRKAILCCNFGIDGVDGKEIGLIEWLKNRLKYIYLHPKQECSEEDEQKPGNKCSGCNNVKGCITCVNGDQWAHIEEEKPVWKPSEEQMGALKSARYMMSLSGDYYDTTVIIDSLITDLKKLM